jgi:hypothetical protein
VSRDLKVQAEGYRLGLLSGYFTNDDVIAWADQVIVDEDHPCSEIIEVALGRKLNSLHLANRLKDIKGEGDLDSVFKIILSLYSKDFRMRTKTSADIVNSLYYINNLVDLPDIYIESIRYFIYGFEVAVYEIYGNLQNLENELRDFLSQYEIFVDVLLNTNQEAKEVN